MIIVGIDPGATGAVAILDGNNGDLLTVADMPYLDGSVSAPLLAKLVELGTGDDDAEAIVERAQAMPRQGVSSSFRYGVGYGVILGVLGALEVATMTVRPQAWKRALRLSTDKAASRRRAIELWPGRAELFARAKDDGRAEAALIARWWMTERLR